MEPKIERGDVLFVERNETDIFEPGFPKRGRVYFLHHGGEYYFRYLSPYTRVDGSFALMLTAEDRSLGIEVIEFPLEREKANLKAKKIILGHVIYFTRKGA
jgi:hypothetical protein